MTEPNQAPPADQPPEQSPGAEGGSRLQDRINQLTERRHAAERAAAEARAENARLTEAVQALTAKVETISRTPATTPASSPMFGDSGTPPAAASPNDVSSLIEAAVQRALRPIQEREQQAAAQEALQRAQVASFQEAAQDLPGLAKVGSPEQQLFDQLWQGNPSIQTMPNAPGLIAAAVRGLLVSQGASDQHRRLATSPAPGAPQARLNLLPGQDPAAATAAEVQRLAAKGADRGLEADELHKLLSLKLGRAQMKG